MNNIHIESWKVTVGTCIFAIAFGYMSYIFLSHAHVMDKILGVLIGILSITLGILTLILIIEWPDVKEEK